MKLTSKSNAPELPNPLKIPTPVGWQMLVIPYIPPEKSAGGIILVDQTRDADQAASQTGYVYDMGSSAYSDTSRFPDGPWADVGDWVLLSKWGGRRFTIEGISMRMINDDEVLGVVPDPEALYATVGKATFDT